MVSNTPPSFTSHNFSDNTNWETVAVHTSMAEAAIRKATGRVNASLECWGCTNFSRYHLDRFHTYRKFPNKIYPDMAERAKRSIKEYAQWNSEVGGSRGSQGIQYGRGKTSSTTTCSMFATCRDQLYQLWNEEWINSLDQALLIYKIAYPSSSRSTQVVCAAAIKNKLT